MPNEPLYNVVLHNDDVTPMEFVVQVLQGFIGLDYEGAIKLMLRIHHEGKASHGAYTLEQAEATIAGILAFAHEHNHPLGCTLEEAR
jgi:ATP-dependent Clp protease adaptor protein ClpS